MPDRALIAVIVVCLPFCRGRRPLRFHALMRHRVALPRQGVATAFPATLSLSGWRLLGRLLILLYGTSIRLGQSRPVLRHGISWWPGFPAFPLTPTASRRLALGTV
ncbi:hypothetical protein ACQZ61_11240 [Agrobacterium vitis]|uniref:hypothetical protein n=1 Tax=Agrobacterium vitis TaxID=373 RepID=UPI0015DD35B3|nr:hypothetical protein RvVAR031_09970 [Agrobacterium vitis]